MGAAPVRTAAVFLEVLLMTKGISRRIDAHHHYWHYSRAEFDWITDEVAALRRDFLPAEMNSERSGVGVTASVAVQAREQTEETRWLLQLAEEEPSIWGVVGWLPLADRRLPAIIEEFSGHSRLRGLRHVVQKEEDGFLDQVDFNEGLRAMGQYSDFSLVFDLLIRSRQLPEAIRFVDRHPNQTFVLDHVAKPAIAQGEMFPWATDLLELGRRRNVCCKISGMVTEAAWQNWTTEQLEPYFQAALNAFGPDRLMVGSDWPVLTVACTYQRWWGVVDKWISSLSDEEQRWILGENAIQIYALPQEAS